jgi:hypothetical protein
LLSSFTISFPSFSVVIPNRSLLSPGPINSNLSTLSCADHVSYDYKVEVHETIPPGSERGFMLMGAL